MVAVRLISRTELEARLKPYGCKCVGKDSSGLERWVTGWGAAFVLWVENDLYDEWHYFSVMGRVIGPTMPPNWNGK
jgi:hypothetical protein